MLALLFLLYGLGSSTTCLTQTYLDTLGITPSDRNCGPFNTGYMNWESGRFSTAIQTILLRDAMGYSFNAPLKFDGPPFDKFEDGELDFMPEVWYGQNKDRVKELSIDTDILSNYAEGGYSGTAGWYVPDYSAADAANGDLAYFNFKSNATLRSKFSTNFTDFILNDADLLDRMNQTGCLSNATLPNAVFSPPICETETCMDVIAMSIDWDPNYFQAQIVNLQLPWRITYWCWGGEHKLVKALYKARRHVVFYVYTPDTLPFKAPSVPVIFPKVTDACTNGHNTNNTQGLYSTVNCDFPRTALIKMARKAALESECSFELHGFLGQFQVPSSAMDSLLNDTLVTTVPYTLDNSAFEATACTWIKAHPEVWSGWIKNEYIYGDSLSAEEIALYCLASVIGVLCIAFVGWKLGFMDGLEAVLFDMMIVYIGKIFMDMFDLFSDCASYFSAVNGVDYIPMWFNTLYVIIVGASAVAAFAAIYFNAKTAYEAFMTRAHVVAEDVDDEEMMKIRARSSLWQGSQGRPRQSDLHKDDDLEKIWTQEELDFAIKRIGDCYVALGIAVSEDIPMLGLNVYLMFYYPEVMTTFVYVSLFLSIFFLGVRLNQFYKIVMYRKQHEYAQKAHELHERQMEIQRGIQGLANNKV